MLNFIKTGVILLMTASLYSCTKSSPVSDSTSSENRISSEQALPISITNEQYKNLLNTFDHSSKRDSLIRTYIDSSLKSSSTIGHQAARTGADYDPNYDPGLGEEVYIASNWADPQSTATSWAAEYVRYNHRVTFTFNQRNVVFAVVVPLQYKDWLYDLGSDVTLVRSPDMFLYGTAIGSVERPYPAYAFATGGNLEIRGKSNGDMLEKRTIIRTSKDRVIVKAGINIEGIQIGSTIGTDETVQSVTSNIMNYRYDISFSLSFFPYREAYNPRPTTTGYCRYSGTIVN